MTIKANKHAADDKAVKDFEIDYGVKDLFDMSKLSSKQTINKYDYYFRHVQDLDTCLVFNI